MPTRCAACDHWCLRCSVGVTTVTDATSRRASRSAAIGQRERRLARARRRDQQEVPAREPKVLRYAAFCQGRSEPSRSGRTGARAVAWRHRGSRGRGCSQGRNATRRQPGRPAAATGGSRRPGPRGPSLTSRGLREIAERAPNVLSRNTRAITHWYSRVHTDGAFGIMVAWQLGPHWRPMMAVPHPTLEQAATMGSGPDRSVRRCSDASARARWARSTWAGRRPGGWSR